MGERKTQLFWNMRRFLRKTRVPSGLSTRIKTYLENKWDHQQQPLKQGNVEVLALLSDCLKAELALCVHSIALNVHPLLRELHADEATIVTMQRLASSALSQIDLAPRDV